MSGERALSVSNGSTATGTTTISCDGTLHTVDRQVTFTAMRGFSSQSAAYRSYVYSYTERRGFWTDWSATTAPGTQIGYTNLPFELGTNNYAIYMQYSWFDGSSWTSPVGSWQQTLHPEGPLRPQLPVLLHRLTP